MRGPRRPGCPRPRPASIAPRKFGRPRPRPASIAQRKFGRPRPRPASIAPRKPGCPHPHPASIAPRNQDRARPRPASIVPRNQDRAHPRPASIAPRPCNVLRRPRRRSANLVQYNGLPKRRSGSPFLCPVLPPFRLPPLLAAAVDNPQRRWGDQNLLPAPV